MNDERADQEIREAIDAYGYAAVLLEGATVAREKRNEILGKRRKLILGKRDEPEQERLRAMSQQLEVMMHEIETAAARLAPNERIAGSDAGGVVTRVIGNEPPNYARFLSIVLLCIDEHAPMGSEGPLVRVLPHLAKAASAAIDINVLEQLFFEQQQLGLEASRRRLAASAAKGAATRAAKAPTRTPNRLSRAPMPTPRTYRTLPVAGAAYANLDKGCLTHTLSTSASGEDAVLCRSVKLESLLDDAAVGDETAKPTCKTCAKRDPRFS